MLTIFSNSLSPLFNYFEGRSIKVKSSKKEPNKFHPSLGEGVRKDNILVSFTPTLRRETDSNLRTKTHDKQIYY